MRRKRTRFSALALAAALAVAAVTAPVRDAQAGVGACLVSCILGAGTGEFLVNGQGDFFSCCIEWLLAGLTAPFLIGVLIWIGSLIDAYYDTSGQQINMLFVTFSLGK